GQELFELLEQWLLPGFDLLPRHSDVEEVRSVDLRKVHLSPRPWRPFHHEGVADDGAGLAVALKCPCLNDFSSLLRHRCQSGEWTCRTEAGFLLEFSLGGFEQVLAWFHFALGNRPSAFVLVLEKGTTGMSKQHLQLAIVEAIHQQSSTDTRHRRQPHCP